MSPAFVILRVLVLLCVVSSNVFGENLKCMDAERGLAPPDPSAQALRERIRIGKADAPGVSVVVPIYRELENGNVFRLLRSFSRQSAAKENFELVLVVNNTSDRADRHDSIYRENVRTVELLKFIAHETDIPPPFLARCSEWERNAVTEARAKLRLHVIDRTSGIERNMGLIRAQGADYVLRRFPPEKGKHLIAMLDADTTVPENYIENAMVHFARSSLGTLFVDARYRVEPGSHEWVYESSSAMRYLSYMGSLTRALRGENWVGGPQIITTVEALEKIGGVPHAEKGEDLLLSRALAQRGNWKWADDMLVTTADRARFDGFDSRSRLTTKDEIAGWARDYGDTDLKWLGWAIWKRYLERGIQVKDEEIRSLFDYFGIPFHAEKWPPMRRLFLQGAFETAALKLLHDSPELQPRDFRPLFAKYGLSDFPDGFRMLKALSEKPFAPVMSWRGQTATIERLRASQLGSPDGSRAIHPDDEGFVRLLERHVDRKELEIVDKTIAAERERHERSVLSLEEAIRARLKALASGGLLTKSYADERTAEFLEGNGWIDHYLLALRRKGISEAEIFKYLATDYPDWFLPFDETPMRRRAVRALAYMELLKEAHNHPESYPTLTRMLKMVRGVK